MESLLPIVASQRERFKVRNMELEAVGSPIGCTNFVSFFVCVFFCRKVPYCLQALGIKDKFFNLKENTNPTLKRRFKLAAVIKALCAKLKQALPDWWNK